MNNFMTVQDFLCLLSFVSASIRVFLLFAPFVEAQYYVFKFSRYISRRGSYRLAQLSNCAGSSLLYIKCCHVAGYPDHLNLVGLLVTCLITLPIFHLRTHRGTLDFPDQVNAYLSKELKLGRIAGPLTLCHSRRDSSSPLSISW